MFLQRLYLSHFRNIEQADLTLDPRITVFEGLNAAGKTSLLEALFFLSYGRSFRSNQARDQIQSGNAQSIVRVHAEDHGEEQVIACSLSTQERRLRLNAQDVKRQTDISRLLPIALFSPDQPGLVHGDPELRRRWLDWGVFHVKQEFADTWKQHQRLLMQRNQALKSHVSHSVLDSIDNQYCRVAVQVDEQRRAYLDMLLPLLLEDLSGLFGKDTVRLSFRSGWSDEVGLEEQLMVSRETDRKMGFTRCGAHRSDVHLHWDGVLAKTRVSRGQERLLSLVFKLSQLRHFYHELGRPAIFLMDDYSSELDHQSQGKLRELLEATPMQMIITALEGQGSEISSAAGKRFHVKRGACEELI